MTDKPLGPMPLYRAVQQPRGYYEIQKLWFGWWKAVDPCVWPCEVEEKLRIYSSPKIIYPKVTP